jgi:hypothetical protein
MRAKALITDNRTGKKIIAVSFEDAVLCDPKCQQGKPLMHYTFKPMAKAEIRPLQAILAQWGYAFTWQGRELARWLVGDSWLCPGFLPSCPVSRRRDSVSSSGRSAHSMRVSRTTRFCTLSRLLGATVSKPGTHGKARACPV